jgi:hypothetical protein
MGISMIIGAVGALIYLKLDASSRATAGFPSVGNISTVIGFVLMIPGDYVMARLAVLLPATAIDERHTMRWAWDITANNGWRLTVVVALLPMLLDTLHALVDLKGHLAVEFLVAVLRYAVVAVEIAVLSIAFRFLSQECRANASGGPEVPTQDDH